MRTSSDEIVKRYQENLDPVEWQLTGNVRRLENGGRTRIEVEIIHLPCNGVEWRTKERLDRCSNKDCQLKKRKDTSLSKYGTSHPSQSILVKQKQQNTNMEKYGVKHVSQVEEFIEKAQQTKQEKYGASQMSKTAKERSRQTKIKNGTIVATEEQIVCTAQEYYETNERKPTKTEVARRLGYNNPSGLCNRITGSENSEKLNTLFSQSGSLPQNEMYNWLKSHVPDLVAEYYIPSLKIYLDMYSPSLSIGVEYNGLAYHSSNMNHPRKAPKEKNYHVDRMRNCYQLGIRLVQIFSDEWLSKQEIIKSKLLHIFKTSSLKTIGARQCQIRDISPSAKNQFLNANHIQGADSASIKLGLFHKETLVAAMTFRKRTVGNIFELSRYATDIKLNIAGGFAKLLSHAINNHISADIITFADLRFSSVDNSIYSLNGFEQLEITKPNYYYSLNDFSKRSRIKYQKHKLKNMKNYSEDKTEAGIMEEEGFYQIYDCGNIKFIKRGR